MQREANPSDLTDAQWAAVEPLIPPPAVGGRKREVDMRAVVNAVRYLMATRCGWRGLPDSFPHRSTVRHYYDAWRASGVWERIEAAVCRVADSESSPTPDFLNDESAPKPGDGTS
jgi:transposase